MSERKIYMKLQLDLEVCPHCGITRPTMTQMVVQATTAYDGTHHRTWGMYKCSTCGGVALAVGLHNPVVGFVEILGIWPSRKAVSDSIPERTQAYMTQALASRHAPAGAIMLTASAIDSMLKDKGYKEGSLHSRIEQAAAAHLITAEMAAWAHEVRLDANDQRHADEEAPLPTSTEAEKTFEFADALAQFLYVLPTLVTRGRKPTAAS